MAVNGSRSVWEAAMQTWPSDFFYPEADSSISSHEARQDHIVQLLKGYLCLHLFSGIFIIGNLSTFKTAQVWMINDVGAPSMSHACWTRACRPSPLTPRPSHFSAPVRNCFQFPGCNVLFHPSFWRRLRFLTVLLPYVQQYSHHIFISFIRLLENGAYFDWTVCIANILH